MEPRSTGGLVGYDDWFTPSRSGVRFPLGVYFFNAVMEERVSPIFSIVFLFRVQAASCENSNKFTNWLNSRCNNTTLS
jgi:hypothetical protein